jgi:drug/metabolite transporter (DMT)-like permease
VTRRAWILFASMCVIWGVPYLMIRVAVRELSPSFLVLLRTAIGAALLVPLAARRGELRPLLPYWRPLLVFSAVEIALPWLLLARAEQEISSSLTGLLLAAVPLVGAAVFAFTGGDEGLGGRRLAGLVVGILGVVAILGLDLGDVTAAPLLQVGVVAVCYAIGPIILARKLSGAPALGVVAASLALAAVPYVPAAFLSAPDSMPSGRVLASVVGLSVLCTAIAFVVFFALIAEAGPVRPMAFTYVNPAVAAILGVALLGEPFTVGMAIGFALVLVGSVLATSRKRAAAPEVAPA